MDEQPDKAELERRLAEERATAARAAADDADGDDDEQVDETDDEQVDETDVDERSDEARAEELGLIVDTFEVTLREVLGADTPLDPVPMDGAIGFMVPGALALKTNEKYTQCATCNGHGQVLTGSLADQKQTADCPRCAGRGYLERMEDVPADSAAEGVNGNVETDSQAGYGVPRWMGDPAVGQS